MALRVYVLFDYLTNNETDLRATRSCRPVHARFRGHPGQLHVCVRRGAGQARWSDVSSYGVHPDASISFRVAVCGADTGVL